MGGRVDLSQAEAVMDLIRAKTDKSNESRYQPIRW